MRYMYGKVLTGGLTPPSYCCVAIRVDPQEGQMSCCCCVGRGGDPPLVLLLRWGVDPPMRMLGCCCVGFGEKSNILASVQKARKKTETYVTRLSVHDFF